MDNIIHDLKTQRQGVSGGLPGAYKIIPIAFYAGVVFSLALSLFFYLSIREYKSKKLQWEMQTSQAKSAQNKFLTSHQEIVDLTEKAQGLAGWLEGARPLQPVTTAIGRSMSEDSTIAELAFDRNPEIPAHTFMQLKINGGGTDQIESTLASINALNYQTYSAQQVKATNATDFQATLIYSDRK
ncbi:MAG: hypothetical protein P1U89_23755 [Verrucomicrobiales bacterium]|nr:hypothetical protein [Verrucomicrobiales bacterium]